MSDDRPGAAGFPAGFSAGSRIAGYRLEEQIGEGGMAVVFRARDERLHRQVALKILSPALATDDEFRRRFIRESRSAAAVDDPHIIPVFEAGDANGVLFIAMRFVPGGDVGTLVRRLGPLPGPRVAAIVSAMASALDAAHAAGLVHRDVKPANMLVDARPGRPDHVYLSDFGLTKGAWSSTSLTATGHFMGTLDYSAPEQIRGEKVDARTDEYALACVAFALLCGRPPFHRGEAMAVMYAQLSEPPPALGSLRAGLAPEVEHVMRRALAKSPGERYPSCGEFADALRVALGLGRYSSDASHEPGPASPDGRLASPDGPPASLAEHVSQTISSVTGHSGHPDHAGEDLGHHRRTLARQQHTLGHDHPDTLAARFDIARELAARGDHAGAEEEFRAVLAARQRKLGPEHPQTLIARFSMAQQLAAGGNHAGAEEEFRGLLTGLRRRLGPDHPDTLATWFSIAQQLAARGDRARAEKEFRYMLPHLQRKLGPDHPVTLIARFSAAQQLAARGDRAAAEQEFRHMLPHLRGKLGPDHPHTLEAMAWIRSLPFLSSGALPGSRRTGRRGRGPEG